MGQWCSLFIAYFWRLHLGFKMYKSCVSVIIILMDKKCKYHQILLIAELVFSDNPKVKLGFC